MATTLWPIIHRLSELLSLKKDLELAVRTNAPPSKVAVLRTEFESTTGAIETALTQWQPHLPPNFVPDEEDPEPPQAIAPSPIDNGSASDAAVVEPEPDPLSASERARLHSILHNALAYRHSAFVYLYRTIYAYPRSHDTVQMHTRLALRHCVSTVAYEGPMGALLWPLFAAACEAMSSEDRELAARAFTAITKRQGMMNIERAWEIVQEVWRRADWADVVARLGEAGVIYPSNSSSGSGSSSSSSNANSSNASGTSVSSGAGKERVAREVARDAELWRRVSREMGVSIVFG